MDVRSWFVPALGSHAVWRTRMKFFYELIDIFIEPFILIIGPVVVCLFIGLALFSYTDYVKKKKEKNKLTERKLLTDNRA
jgi:hypothetical protein